MVIHQCRLRAINRNKYTLNFNGTILHPVYNVALEGKVFKKANGLPSLEIVPQGKRYIPDARGSL